ncbi:hypothetical protein VE00_03125 [Pseudogymnoascus sp. WSF 3629]|nr:hypothetical protein VE00_03125 [Pseudogymnoascus sp. WSF 3629]
MLLSTPQVVWSLMLLLNSSVHAQQTVGGQCGGEHWTGPTKCVQGNTCVYISPWYSECFPGIGARTTTTTTSSSDVPLETPIENEG